MLASHESATANFQWMLDGAQRHYRPPPNLTVKASATRRVGNTLALKEFSGGFLKLTGANSGAGLRSDQVPLVLLDEVD
jgi:phage terminase large subunit GpA-like protein